MPGTVACQAAAQSRGRVGTVPRRTACAAAPARPGPATADEPAPRNPADAHGRRPEPPVDGGAATAESGVVAPRAGSPRGRCTADGTGYRPRGGPGGGAGFRPWRVEAWEAATSRILGGGPLGHEPLGGRRDPLVLGAEEVPGRDGPPGRRTRRLVEPGTAPRPLRRRYHVGRVAADVGGEGRVELLAVEVEVLAGLAPVPGGEGRGPDGRGRQAASAAFLEDLGDALALVRHPPAEVDERLDLVVPTAADETTADPRPGHALTLRRRAAGGLPAVLAQRHHGPFPPELPRTTHDGGRAGHARDPHAGPASPRLRQLHAQRARRGTRRGRAGGHGSAAHAGPVRARRPAAPAPGAVPGLPRAVRHLHRPVLAAVRLDRARHGRLGSRGRVPVVPRHPPPAVRQGARTRARGAARGDDRRARGGGGRFLPAVPHAARARAP